MLCYAMHVGSVCGSAGANVPALNRLLSPFGIAFGTGVYVGGYTLGGSKVADSIV